MKNLHARLAVIAATVFFLAGCADEALGPEYGEISEEESGLQFYAPGLKGGYRNFIYGQDERYVKRVVGVYGPKQGEFPRGQLVLIEMPPRLYFPRASSPRDTIDDWEQFKNRAITHGTGDTVVNKIGRIGYATFLADNLSCVVFRQIFGTAYGSGGGGTRLIVGYYCKGETAIMTEGEAVAIVKAVGHRKHGPIEPPEGWSESLSLRIQAIWGNDSSDVDKFEGKIRIPSDGSDGTIRIGPDAERNCSGIVTFDRQEEKTIYMLWSLSCTDGVTATGTLRLRKISDSAYLFGEGEDSKGRNVAIID